MPQLQRTITSNQSLVSQISNFKTKAELKIANFYITTPTLKHQEITKQGSPIPHEEQTRSKPWRSGGAMKGYKSCYLASKRMTG